MAPFILTMLQVICSSIMRSPLQHMIIVTLSLAYDHCSTLFKQLEDPCKEIICIVFMHTVVILLLLYFCKTILFFLVQSFALYTDD